MAAPTIDPPNPCRKMPSSLQQRTILCGGGYQHYYRGVMPLSVKSFTGGAVQYHTDRGRYTVSEGTWLVLNDQEPYTIEFDSRTPIRSTVVFFPDGWAENVARVSTERTDTLLDEPNEPSAAFEFLQTVTPDDSRILPRLKVLDLACRGKTAPEGWLEEQLRDLLADLIRSQSDHGRRADGLPAARAATRRELYRRVCRGRDFLYSHADSAPTLAEAARAASLSPYHFQRSFKAAFGQTPHAFVTERRLTRAHHLLTREGRSATDAAAVAGYESYSAFYDAYRRRFQKPPSQSI